MNAVRNLPWIIPLVGILLLWLSACGRREVREDNNHETYFDSIYQYAETHRDEAVVFLDSVYRTVPDVGPRDLYRKYFFMWYVYAEVYKEFNVSMAYADSAILTMQKLASHTAQDKSDYAKAYFMKGDDLLALRKYEEAIQYYYLGKQVMMDVADSCSLIEYTTRLAKVYYNQGKYNEAAQTFKQCVNQLSYCQKDDYRVRNQQRNIDNVGLCFYYLHMFDSALYYYDSAEAFINRNEKKFPGKEYSEAALAVVYGNKGDIYYERGDTTNAGILFRKSIDLNFRKNREPRDAQLTMIKLAKMYLETGRFNEAARYLQTVRVSMDTLHNETAERRWGLLQKRYLDTTHQTEKAYKHYVRYVNMMDSLKSVEHIPGFDINNEYDNIKRMYDVALLKRQNQLKNTYLVISVLFSVMVSIIVLLVWRNQKKTQKNEAELIVAKNVAEEAAKAKQQFLSNMSHEIRTPMNAVIGITHLLLQDRLSPEQEANIRSLKVASTNLMGLLNDILDYNKIDAGKIVLEEIDFSIHDLIKSIQVGHRHTAEEKGITLNCEIDEKIPEILSGDSIRLTQVINNLVSNAIKFTNSGTVSISVSLNNLMDELASIRWEVTDTGIGIDPEHLDTIFDSFTQASSETTRKFGGSGLGLAITKRLLELQGSTIQVRSVKNSGSTFYFDLTLKVSQKNKRDLTQSYSGVVMDSYDLSQYRVLIVDDNEMNIQVLRKLLSRWDIQADSTTSGVNALSMLQEKNYDVVLLDLQMPEMSGYEVAKHVREFADKQKAQTPIIALTADVMPETKTNALSAGMNDYVSKPFNPTELYSKMVTLLAKEN